jgi:hypothetical protein
MKYTTQKSHNPMRRLELLDKSCLGRRARFITWTIYFQ